MMSLSSQALECKQSKDQDESWPMQWSVAAQERRIFLLDSLEHFKEFDK